MPRQTICKPTRKLAGMLHRPDGLATLYHAREQRRQKRGPSNLGGGTRGRSSYRRRTVTGRPYLDYARPVGPSKRGEHSAAAVVAKAQAAIMRPMDDLYDIVLIGAGVLVVCVLIAYSPFTTHRPRHPMLFGILSAAVIMAVFLLAHLM